MNKKIAQYAVVTIKLIGGDEVVARLREEYNPGDDLLVSKPAVVMMAQEGFGLMPLAITIDPDEQMVINRASVITVAKTLQKVADLYLQQTSSLVV